MRVILILACALLFSSTHADRASRGTEDLLSAVAKRNVKAIGELVGVKDVDPNQPGAKGQMPLIEAVKGGDFEVVDTLIHYGAFANVKEPATGVTPLLLAHERGNGKIARLLVQYGANPNEKDKRGMAAREYVPTEELRELVLLYDKAGHEAFEDAPGDWIRHKSDAGEPYYFNVKTEASRWTPPPSCAWKVVSVRGQALDYINSITSQEIHRTPKALAWRQVVQAGDTFWYNWKTNHSQHEAPGELPLDLLEELQQPSHTNLRWVHRITGEVTWEDPHLHTAWRAVTEEKSGETYYHNVLTGNTTWDIPDDMAWEKHIDEQAGQTYYFNTKTGSSEWEAPHHLAWEAHTSEL